jgi:hypothetical protein
MRPAMQSRSASSVSDSQLNPWMPLESAYSISGAVSARAQDAEEFATGNDVEARAFFREQLQNRERGVGLHRIADGVRKVAESEVVIAVGFADGVGRIDITGRARLPRNLI